MPRKKVMEVVAYGKNISNKGLRKFANKRWQFEKNTDERYPKVVGKLTKNMPMRKGETGNTELVSNRAMRLTKKK